MSKLYHFKCPFIIPARTCRKKCTFSLLFKTSCNKAPFFKLGFHLTHRKGQCQVLGKLLAQACRCFSGIWRGWFPQQGQLVNQSKKKTKLNKKDFLQELWEVCWCDSAIQIKLNWVKNWIDKLETYYCWNGKKWSKVTGQSTLLAESQSPCSVFDIRIYGITQLQINSRSILLFYLFF